MGQFSVKNSGLPGSHLSGNQQMAMAFNEFAAIMLQFSGLDQSAFELSISDDGGVFKRGFVSKTTGRPKSGMPCSPHDLAHAPAVWLCSPGNFAPQPIEPYRRRDHFDQNWSDARLSKTEMAVRMAPAILGGFMEKQSREPFGRGGVPFRLAEQTFTTGVRAW
jgi:hypothetical protein